MNPVQAVLMSIAAARAPSESWTRLATAGEPRSGVIVATITSSTSSGSRPASASAAWPAASPRLNVDSSSPAMRRSLIPVRVQIHSSEVSTISASAWLVRTWEGRARPRPAIRAGI